MSTDDSSPDAPSDPNPSPAEVHVTAVDPDAGERASEAVVTAVAALTDEVPVDLPALYDAVDPDAIDSLVDHAQRLDEPASLRLSFEYEGYRVCVRGDGSIRLRPSGSRDGPPA